MRPINESVAHVLQHEGMIAEEIKKPKCPHCGSQREPRYGPKGTKIKWRGSAQCVDCDEMFSGHG